MNLDLHERARQLIAIGELENVAPAEQNWLQAHLRDCDSCRLYAESVGQAIRSLRSVPLAAGPELVRATQARVRLRASELRHKQDRLWAVWMACTFVGLSAAITTPLLWRGFAWLGEWARLSTPVWQASFAIFWIAPALVASILFLARGTHLADGTKGWRE